MTLSAPEHIRGRIRGVGMKAKINARGVFIRQALVAGHTAQQIAAALDTQPSQLREGYRSLFDELEGRAKPSAPRVPRAVIHVAGQPVSLAPLPWEITPDARHETAPRHRGLIGSRVDRNEPVDHTDRILSALMHHDTLREGRVS